MIPCLLAAACTSGPRGAVDAGQGTGGSGPTDSGAPAYVSGSRLRVNYLVAEDGTRVPYNGLFDTKYGVNCAFELTADAGWRCIPVSPVDGGYATPDLVGGTIVTE